MPRIRLRFGDHPESHPRMLRAAKFRARPEVRSRLVGLQPNIARPARHGIHLAREFRHPKIMNHVGGFDAHQQSPPKPECGCRRWPRRRWDIARPTTIDGPVTTRSGVWPPSCGASIATIARTVMTNSTPTINSGTTVHRISIPRDPKFGRVRRRRRGFDIAARSRSRHSRQSRRSPPRSAEPTGTPPRWLRFVGNED